MTRRAIAAYLGAIVVIAWAVLTAIAYARRERPVPAQYRDPYTVTLTGGPAVTVRLGDNLTTSDAAGLVWVDWQSEPVN